MRVQTMKMIRSDEAQQMVVENGMTCPGCLRQLSHAEMQVHLDRCPLLQEMVDELPLTMLSEDNGPQYHT